jgi:hypothetical protein
MTESLKHGVQLENKEGKHEDVGMLEPARGSVGV